MSLSDRRILIHTEALLQAYLQNGTLPDELVVKEQLAAEFADFYDATTNTFNVDVPLWQPTNLAYRSISDAAKWNRTQLAAAEDTQIVYADFINDLNTLTTSLFDYINRANLIKNRIANLVSRINNLLLISTSTDGFVYSFFDTFVDTSKTSFISPDITTALVNTATQNVELPVDITTDVSSAQKVTNILNLLFLQPGDIRFSILNPVASQQSLSSAQLSDIFSNQANAWQQEITINGPGPLVCDLTVKVSPLEPILINKIEMNTKMSNYTNQILVQVLTSEDGISYFEVNSPANPQFIGQSAEFNFTPVFASYVKFIITKNTADSGATYNVGFQYISFQEVSYALNADHFSIPISFPDNRAISKVAIETCTIEPNGTGISYFIARPSGNPIPISKDTDINPAFPKVINLGALTDVDQNIYTQTGNLLWTVEPSGRLSVNITDVAGTTSIDSTDITIPNSMTIWRDFGGAVASSPSGVVGWQTNPSGLPIDYFQSYMNITNTQGTQFNIGSSEAFIDRDLTNGAINLTEGLHTIATTALDKVQQIVANNSDTYFAWNMQFESPFDFYNNIDQNNPSIFTYDNLSGDIVINGIRNNSQIPLIDFVDSFLPSLNGDNTYRSSTVALATSSFTAPVVVNAGTAIEVTIGSNPQWINEIQIQVNSSTDTTVSVLASIDNITFTTVLENQPGPIAGTTSFGAIRFNTPVYTKYLQILIGSGSAISMAGGFIRLFPPLLSLPGTVQTEPFTLPSANMWATLEDTIQVNQAQTYSLYNAFDGTLIGTKAYGGMTYVASIVDLHIPKIYAKIHSNSSLDPYIYGVNFNSLALPNEASKIKFSYISPGSINNTNTIIFNAHLVSTQPGITPQLQNYRVKLL